MKKIALIPTLFLTFFSIPLRAWNPDYAYDLPKQRWMCAVEDSVNTLRFTSVVSGEACPAQARRYIVIFGREPQGSMALVPAKTEQRVATLTPPAVSVADAAGLWRFSCTAEQEVKVLETSILTYRYLGELTFPRESDCAVAKQRALDFCKQSMKGQMILESCLGEGLL